MAKQLKFNSNTFRVTRRRTGHADDNRLPNHMPDHIPQRIMHQLGRGISILSSTAALHVIARHVIVGALVCTLATITPTMTWSATLDSLEQAIMPESFEKQSRTIKLISYLVEKSYFRKVPLDNSFSEKVLNRFIDQLDPAKSFFLQEDIDRFETVKYEFDDYIKRGTLEPVYAIFKVFRKRVNQRIEYVLQRLEQSFDFTLNEQFLLDTQQSTWAQSEQSLNDYWRKRIKNDIINLRLAKKSGAAPDHNDADNINETLRNRYTHIVRRTRQFNADDVFQSFINAYVTNIEPHASYYSPRGAENFKIHMRLSLEGIGAVLQTDNEYTLVRRIIAGGPADIADQLKSGDRIIGVGQENEDIVDVIGWRLDDVVELIRGPKGSTVKLDILPGEYGLEGKPETITILRDKIKLEEQSAKKRLFKVETEQSQSIIGVIDLPFFYSDFDGKNVSAPNYRSTTRDVRKLLTELKDEGIDGLIIDLRGNGGGALTEAISLTGLFIRKGPVVQVQNSNGRIQIDRDPDPEIVYNGPLVVLVDRHSASASEILSGAIQDYKRGLIVGEPTFGKGTVQNLVSLNRFVNTKEDLGQLKVTIAQFFRINGDSTQHRGVIPDIIWHTAEREADSGERAYENAIPWRQIDKASFAPFQPSLDAQVLNQTLSRHFSRVKSDPEFAYVLEVNKINKFNRERKFTTLNEDKRREHRKQRDLERLTLENKKRKALGQSTFETVELLDADLYASFNANQDSRNESAESENVVDVDAFLVESGKILTDFVYYKNLSKANSPEAAETASDTELVNQNLLDSVELLSN
ncbi:carboxy terminal-processing peptidase [Candidatus Spongiihabitans sp.]|uniref:carboxy terminal-processing peptidase n=1 Tax=Candidatus Spongiihabitans sp. TaxID=3101308 RepID=UPI003C797B51